MNEPKCLPIVGVIGLGSVGWAVMHGMSQHYRCVGYDIIGDYDWNDILGTSIVFICVSTSEGENGRLDCKQVDTVLKNLEKDSYQGLVVIKSTIGIGYMEKATADFSNLRLIYMPEFLREKSSYSWFMEPDRIVASGSSEDVKDALSYFKWVNGAKILIMDHKSAEIGKLAHNAFIATKVSFTNEIESICNDLSGDPYDVMSVIWADRRVKCKEHLRPGMGSYNGKCVPKDTRELSSSCSKTVLLPAVEEVKGAFSMKSEQEPRPNIVTLIPTKDRPVKLKRALASINAQTVKPDLIVVVSDSNETDQRDTDLAVSQFEDTLNIELIRNSRAKNLSGAINTGFSRVLSDGYNPENTYVALLDDDDWWEEKYIDNNLRFAMETDIDWVISGIIRHNNSQEKGEFQNIPKKISVDDFLVSNPNVQGSNLFIRLSKLIDAGGFDEELVSTTDRDICIRLLSLDNISYSILRNHLVHHNASADETRLSHPGSEKKRKGLQHFYYKYKALMSDIQREKFKERARTLFDIEILDGGIQRTIERTDWLDVD